MPKMFQCFVGYSNSKFDSMFYGFAEDIPNIPNLPRIAVAIGSWHQGFLGYCSP
jgi:hypothetical protein